MAHAEVHAPALGQFFLCNTHAHQLGGGGRMLIAQHSRRCKDGRASKGRKIRSTTSALEEADWEEEMSLFRKRLQKPNQLETMRKIVEEVDLGKVGICLSLPCRRLIRLTVLQAEDTAWVSNCLLPTIRLHSLNDTGQSGAGSADWRRLCCDRRPEQRCPHWVQPQIRQRVLWGAPVAAQ